MQPDDEELLALFCAKEIPHLIVFNKSDLVQNPPALPQNAMLVSAETGEAIPALKERIARLVSTDDLTLRLVGDLIR
ncbi:MAG: [FeFe] hydrogenase H-cluster maturation GTPase HydF, partial [Ruthenibacterium sp.]